MTSDIGTSRQEDFKNNTLMKRLILLLTLVGMVLTSRAQDSELPSQKYSVATASFWSNWFAQADLTASSFFGDRGNAPGTELSSSMFKDYRMRFGFSLALGKWFTPGLGLRTKFGGLWGCTVVSNDKDINASRYWTLDEQVLFNLSNMFCGYSDTRRWNIIPYLSAGVGRNMSYDTYAMSLGLGLLNEWRLSPKASVHLDLSWRVFEPEFDGVGGWGFSSGLHGHDQILSIGVGLTWNLGSGKFNRIQDSEALNVLVESQLEALGAQLEDAQRENMRLRKLLENPEPRPLPKPETVQ